MATRHIIQKVWILAILMLLTGCSRSTALPTPQPTATTAATPTGTSILSEFATISIHVPLVVRGGSRASDYLFEDISHRAGLLTCTPSYSAAWGDYDADGDPDLFVSNHGSPRSLYRNEGGGVFRDVAEAMGIPPKGHDSHGGVWGDRSRISPKLPRFPTPLFPALCMTVLSSARRPKPASAALPRRWGIPPVLSLAGW